jgi:hypothetical protein
LNPIVLPTVATCALIIAITLRQAGLHSKLLKVMSENTEEMVEIVTYTKFAEYIYTLMVAADPTLKDYDMDRKGVEEAAEKLRTNLIIYASPNIFKELRTQGAITNSNIAKIDATRYTKLEGMFGRFYSKMLRVITPDAISSILHENIQDLFNACSRMEKKFSLFIQINHAVFDRVIGGIKNTAYYNKLFKLNVKNTIPLLKDNATPNEIAAYMEQYCAQALGAPLSNIATVDLTQQEQIVTHLNTVAATAVDNQDKVLETAVDAVMQQTNLSEEEVQKRMTELSPELAERWRSRTYSGNNNNNFADINAAIVEVHPELADPKGPATASADPATASADPATASADPATASADPATASAGKTAPPDAAGRSRSRSYIDNNNNFDEINAALAAPDPPARRRTRKQSRRSNRTRRRRDRRHRR